MKQLLWFNDIYVIIYWKYTFTELCEIRIKTHKEVAGLGSWEFLYLSQLLISKSSDKFLLWGNTTPKGDCSGFFFFSSSPEAKCLTWRGADNAEVWHVSDGSKTCMLVSVFPWEIQIELFSSLQTTEFQHNLWAKKIVRQLEKNFQWYN